MRRYELTDEQWEKISDLFPNEECSRGGQWKDHRMVMNGMFWILNSGAPWRDLPERYGNWKTVYDRFRRYKRNGMFDKMVERLHLQLDKDGYIDWQLWAVDSTVIRAHKSAAGAGKKGEQSKSRKNLQTMP